LTDVAVVYDIRRHYCSGNKSTSDTVPKKQVITGIDLPTQPEKTLGI